MISPADLSDLAAWAERQPPKVRRAALLLRHALWIRTANPEEPEDVPMIARYVADLEKAQAEELSSVKSP